MNLSYLFALKYFSSNILGTACFAFPPKLRLDYVVYEFNCCMFIYLLASALFASYRLWLISLLF